MSEVLPDTHQEFWRPPAISAAVGSSSSVPLSLSEPHCCGSCRTEFMPEARFCYLCGAARGMRADAKLSPWTHYFKFLRLLGFQHIKRVLGLPVASLVGFFGGITCLLAAVIVGKVVAAQTMAEFQALQFLRIEWLLGSVAAFIAAVLFKCGGQQDS